MNLQQKRMQALEDVLDVYEMAYKDGSLDYEGYKLLVDDALEQYSEKENRIADSYKRASIFSSVFFYVMVAFSLFTAALIVTDRFMYQ